MQPPPQARTSIYRRVVDYVDSDQSGVVHHSAYFRYLEAARIDLLEARGLCYARMEREQRLGLPVVEAQLWYRSAARCGDALVALSWIGLLTAARLCVETNLEHEGRLVLEARITLACVDLRTGRARRLPEQLRTALG